MKKKRLLFAPLVLVVLGVVLIVVLRSALPPERMIALVEPRLEAALGRDVEIGRASLRFWPLSVRLESVRVQANPGFSSPLLLELQALSLELRLLPLLRRAVDVRTLVLEQPRLCLEQDARGRWNYAKTGASDTIPEKARPAADSPMALRIRTLSLREGSVEVRIAPRDVVVTLPLAADLSVDLDRGLQNVSIRGWIESRSITGGASLQSLPALDLRLEPELRVNLAEQSASIDKLLLQLQEFAFELEGEAAMQDGKPVVHLRTRSNAFELAELLKLMPARGQALEATGRAQLEVAIDVPATGSPRVDGTLSLDEGRVQSPDWPAPLENIRARAVLSGDSLRLGALDANLAGSPLHLEGTLSSLLDPKHTAYDVNLRTQLDLAAFSPLLQQAAPTAKNLEIRGQLKADLRARGTVAEKSLPALHGPVHLRDVLVRTPQLAQPVSLQATLRAAGPHFVVESARLDAGETRLDASGTFAPALPPEKPHLALRGRTERLDLDALLGEQPGAAGSASTSGATAPPSNLLPPLPPVRVELELEAAQARMRQAEVRDATLAWRSDAERFRLDLRAERFQQETMLLQGCQGNLEGTPAEAAGKLTSRAASLGKIQATDLQGDLHVQGSQVQLTNVRARTYEGNLQGRIQLDLADPAQPRQQMDLNMDAVQLSGLMNDLFRAGGLVMGTMSGRSSWTAAGSGAALRSQLSGSGQGIAVKGRLREMPFLSQVSSLLGVPSLSQLQYEELGFEFTVEEGQVRLPRMQLQGNDADVQADGSIGLDGGLNLALNLKLSEALTRQALQNPTTRALGGLFTDPQGRLVLDFDIGGSLEAPKVRADLQATAARTGLRPLGEQELKRLLGNLVPPTEGTKEELGRSVKDAVRGLFQPKPAAKDTTVKP